MRKASRGHQQATQGVLEAGRELGAAAVLFHTLVAERQGLSATEEKALDLLQRFGPLMAGELAARSGLAPPSVTGLLNRLEKKGFVRRVADPADGRKVRVQLVESRLADFHPLFVGLVEGMTELCASYSAEELTLVARFLHEAAACQLAAASRLPGEPPGGPPRR